MLTLDHANPLCHIDELWFATRFISTSFERDLHCHLYWSFPLIEAVTTWKSWLFRPSSPKPCKPSCTPLAAYADPSAKSVRMTSKRGPVVIAYPRVGRIKRMKYLRVIDAYRDIDTEFSRSLYVE